MSKKVLLIDGTGFIGKHILAQLKKDGHQVRVLSRRYSGIRDGVEYTKGDLLNLNSLIQVLKDCEVVIQAAQFPGHPVERPWLGAEFTYEGLDANGTLNVVEALKYSEPSGGVKQYIYLSGAGVGAEHNYSWLQAKKKAEKAIIDSGVAYTIFRPSWVYGKGDQSMSKFILFAKYLPFFPVIGDGSVPVNPIWVDDLALIVSKAVANPEVRDKVFELGPPEMTMKQVAETVLKVVGVSKPVLYHPKLLMKLAGVFAQFIPGSPLSPKSVDFLTMEVYLKNRHEELLGVKIKNLVEGLHLSGLIKN